MAEEEEEETSEGKKEEVPVEAEIEDLKKGKKKAVPKEKKEKPKPEVKKAVPKHIVRVAGKDVDGDLPVKRALIGIKGISHSLAHAVSARIMQELKVKPGTRVGDLDDKQLAQLEEIIGNPGKHGIPVWMFNRKRDIETGADLHITGPELDLKVREDIGRKKKTKSYQGVRHSRGLTVRGQRTRTSGRKGTTMGVVRRKGSKGSGK
jgi:small subunit ribosomal protein S13